MTRDSSSSLLRLSYDNYIHMHSCTLVCTFTSVAVQKGKTIHCKLHFSVFHPNRMAGNVRVDYIQCIMCRSSWVYFLLHHISFE